MPKGFLDVISLFSLDNITFASKKAMRASQQIDHTYQINITNAHADLLNTWSLRYSYWRLLKII